MKCLNCLNEIPPNTYYWHLTVQKSKYYTNKRHTINTNISESFCSVTCMVNWLYINHYGEKK